MEPRRREEGVETAVFRQPLRLTAATDDIAQGVDQKVERFSSIRQRRGVVSIGKNFFQDALRVRHKSARRDQQSLLPPITTRRFGEILFCKMFCMATSVPDCDFEQLPHAPW